MIIIVVPEVDKKFEDDVVSKKRKKTVRKRRKREIRVFVSSTFRDFKEEREELIKKTFREVSNM